MADWVVGKSDFNENQVVSPDLDLNFGFVKTVVMKKRFSTVCIRELTKSAQSIIGPSTEIIKKIR